MAARQFGQKHWASFGGADIKAAFGNREIGTLQAFSYAIQREKAPIYTMGNKNPFGFSRGKRGIAGTLVFIVLDQHALLEELGIRSDAPAGTMDFLSANDEYRPSEPAGVTNIDVNAPQEILDIVDDTTGDISFGASYSLSKAWFVDQIPPFDITVTAVNEYGAAMFMRVIGVELLNEGYGISVDDIVSEQQTTYVCRTLSPWTAHRQWETKTAGSILSVVETLDPT
jgi:hypothetical protein